MELLTQHQRPLLKKGDYEKCLLQPEESTFIGGDARTELIAINYLLPQKSPGSNLDNHLGPYLQPEKPLELLRNWNYFIHWSGNFKGKI